MSDLGINLTAIMERENIAYIQRKRALPFDGWYFAVKLVDDVFEGLGQTVGEALADAKARNAERRAA